METTEKILKMMELDGRRNFLNKQVAEKVAEITGIVSAVENEGAGKASFMADRNRAINSVAQACDTLTNAGLTLEVAQKALTDAEMAKTSAEGRLAEYSPEALAAYDNRVAKLQKAKAKAEKEKAGIIAEAEKVQAEIEALQAELKEQGIDLNIDQSRKPKTAIV